MISDSDIKLLENNLYNILIDTNISINKVELQYYFKHFSQKKELLSSIIDIVYTNIFSDLHKINNIQDVLNIYNKVVINTHLLDDTMNNIVGRYNIKNIFFNILEIHVKKYIDTEYFIKLLSNIEDDILKYQDEFIELCELYINYSNSRDSQFIKYLQKIITPSIITELLFKFNESIMKRTSNKYTKNIFSLLFLLHNNSFVLNMYKSLLIERLIEGSDIKLEKELIKKLPKEPNNIYLQLNIIINDFYNSYKYTSYYKTQKYEIVSDKYDYEIIDTVKNKILFYINNPTIYEPNTLTSICPPILKPYYDLFEIQYKRVHTGYELNIDTKRSIININLGINNQLYNLDVNMFQLYVLNYIEKYKIVTLNNLIKTMNITLNEMMATINSLLYHKIICRSNTKSNDLEMKLTFNKELLSQYKINLVTTFNDIITKKQNNSILNIIIISNIINNDKLTLSDLISKISASHKTFSNYEIEKEVKTLIHEKKLCIDNDLIKIMIE